MSNVPGVARFVALFVFITMMATLVAIVLPSLAAAATPGGIATTAPEYTPEESGEPEAGETGEATAAMLVRGRALAPLDAPAAVRRVIAFANKIRAKPYVWGGGHGRWWDRGYDCSGAVSFALHGGSFLESPLPSGPMEHWGSPGPGRWITVYANAGHAFAVIAGLRWDTVGDRTGTGPRWHKNMVSTKGFVARHPTGY
jgi:hypothetical protein